VDFYPLKKKKSWRISNKIKLDKNEVEVFILLSTYQQNSEFKIKHIYFYGKCTIERKPIHQKC
jgi:hypothetical protein